MTEVLISLLLLVVPLHSQAGTAGRSFPSLADLDAVVQNSEAYDLPRLHRIDSCRALLDRSEISDRERFFLMEEMRTLYDKYRTDSAIVYASKALSIAEKIGERSLIDRSLAGLAKEFGTSGLYDESLALLDRIDRRAMDEDSLADMFYLYYFDYESLANQCLEPEMAKHFRRLSCMCRDSILLYRPGYTVFSGYAIEHPYVYILNPTYPDGGYYPWMTTNDKSYRAFWGGADSNKTLFDPCPAGWRVCNKIEAESFIQTVSTTATLASNLVGYDFDGHYLPMTGTRGNKNMRTTNVRSCGYETKSYMWTSEILTNHNYGYAHTAAMIAPANYADTGKPNALTVKIEGQDRYLTQACPVRCVKE